MTNAVIYTRVSTREQSEEGSSLDIQLEECRALAAEFSLEVTAEHEFSDVATGTARTKRARPGYFAMMAAVRSDAAHHIIAWKEDRLYRGFGVVPFYELVEVAQWESEVHSERIRAALDRKRQRGERLGWPSKISDEAKARIAELRDSGLSWAKVANRLNEIGVGTPSGKGKWHPATASRHYGVADG